MEKVLLVDMEKCTGCRTCEEACSLRNAGQSNPNRSRIRIIRYEKQGQYHNYVPMVCQQCATPLCMEACPVNAMARHPETQAITVDGDACVGCRVCSMVCPTGGISMDPATNTANKCELCDGDPQCARHCQPEAITYIPREKADILLKRDKSRKLTELLTLIQTLR